MRRFDVPILERAGSGSRREHPMSAGAGEVQYLVLPDSTNPYLLARVRWPDVFEAISPVRPDWQVDPGLFDLAYDPTSTRVTLEEAAAIAADWGAQLCSDVDETPKTQLMRRMPANWSDMSRAEKRSWSIEYTKPAKVQANGHAALGAAGARATEGSRFGRLRPRRRGVDPALDPAEVLHEELIPDFDLTEDVIDLRDDVIDLTDARVNASVEDA